MARAAKKVDQSPKSKRGMAGTPSMVFWSVAWVCALLQGFAAGFFFYAAGKDIFYDRGNEFRPGEAAFAIVLAVILIITLLGHVAYLDSKISALEKKGHNMRFARKLQSIIYRMLDGIQIF